MPKQTVEIEVPDGYELIAYRVPKDGEFVLWEGKVESFDFQSSEYPILKKTRVSLHKFYTGALDLMTRQYVKNNPADRWRYGQCMFNHLCAVKPELAEKVRGTNCDPFNCLNTDPQFDRFIKFIESNWER